MDVNLLLINIIFHKLLVEIEVSIQLLLIIVPEFRVVHFIYLVLVCLSAHRLIVNVLLQFLITHSASIPRWLLIGISTLNAIGASRSIKSAVAVTCQNIRYPS